MDAIEAAADALDAVADRVLYDGILRLFPELATRLGVHDHDARLSDPGPAGRREYAAILERARRKLDAIDAPALEAAQRTAFEIVSLWLDTEITGLPFGGTTFVLDPLHGFHLELPKLFDEMRYRGAEDYRIALARLAAVPRYVDGVIESLRADLRDGRPEARPVVEKVLAQLDFQLALAPEEHPFFARFRAAASATTPSSPASEHIDETAAEARSLLVDHVLPAWRRAREFVATEYLPLARDDVGIWATAGGDERYDWCVRRYTTTALSAEEIHAIGMREVARIRREMESIRARVGFDGDLRAFFEHLRSEPRFYYDDPEDLLTGYRAICKRADAALPNLFGRLPRHPYGVTPIPDFAARSATSAYYNAPPADGSRPGWFYANTYRLEMRPRYEMEALALHEAVPGHHLQLSLQLELEGVSKLRSRVIEFTSFVEGWGLYAERLGIEMGFYTDPYSDFGRLTFEMWRACRLVVDTGMHRLRWTREQAIEFLLANSALSRLNVESEIDRYITWPGQALAYKIGELEIRRLRALSESELAERFDVRAFHDVVLAAGSLPLAMLDARVRAWVAARQRDDAAR